MINSSKIKGRMRERDITQAEAAHYLGIAQSTMNQKINNGRALYLDEAEKLCILLNIPLSEFGLYFFN